MTDSATVNELQVDLAACCTHDSQDTARAPWWSWFWDPKWEKVTGIVWLHISSAYIWYPLRKNSLIPVYECFFGMYQAHWRYPSIGWWMAQENSSQGQRLGPWCGMWLSCRRSVELMFGPSHIQFASYCTVQPRKSIKVQKRESRNGPTNIMFQAEKHIKD